MNIYIAISNCMAEIGAIAKEQKNVQQGFKYRGIDDVMNALQPVMIKNHVFAIPEVLEERREERTSKSGGNLIYTVLKMKYTFYAEDGSNVSATVIGEGMDSGDKSANKAMAIAFKYACFQVFCIPTEEMKGPDGDTPPPSEAKPMTIAEAANVTLNFDKYKGKKLGEIYREDIKYIALLAKNEGGKTDKTILKAIGILKQAAADNKVKNPKIVDIAPNVSLPFKGVE
jgi:DNA-directed RNA polymerase subunit F